MLDSSRVFTLFKVVIAFVICGWTLSYLGLSTNYREVFRKFKSEKELFVRNFLDNDIGAPFRGDAIASLCRNQTWTKGLIFHCDPAPGGIAQVRNAHLNCIRFAMEAGAELVLPEIVRRNDKDITKILPNSKGTPRGTPLDYYYDKQHLNKTMSTLCPQMKLYWSIDELYNVPMGNPLQVSVDDMQMTKVNETIIEKPYLWGRTWAAYLDWKTNPKTRPWPFKADIRLTLYAWPTSYDPPAFVKNFGRILRFREDARQLAASALFNLQKTYLPPQAAAPATTRDELDLEPISKSGYVGVHLRTEKDVWGAEIPSYDEQAAYYLSYIVPSPHRIVYLASGATPENITAFTERAREFNITVVTKKDLLEPEERQILASLTWDQQAVVDYEMMLRADAMAGVCESIFAWNIALTRSASTGSIGGKTLIPQTEFIRWQDAPGTSVIFGKGNKNANMQLATWP